MNIREAAVVATGVAIGAAGVGLGVAAGEADLDHLYSPFEMTRRGGNPIGVLANGTFMLGLGALAGSSALATKMGSVPGSGASAIAVGVALLGAGPGGWLAAHLASRD